ncbi:SSD domain-containing protein [Aphelenchoides fujianensis]|nr:SSD domain-containing protein [Aphelenchoides fujianensis]
MADGRRVSNRLFSERRRGSILVGQRSIDLMAMNQQGGKDSGPRFVKFIIRQYKRWGYFICDHDWKALIICSLLSLAGLIQVLRNANDITGYTPYGARALDEYAAYQDFFSAKGLGVAVYLFALAKDGGTMLREPYLKEAIDILDEAMDNVTTGLHVQNDLAKRHQKLNGRMILRYPITNLFGRSITLQQNFYGLEFYEDGERDKTAALLRADGDEGERDDRPHRRPMIVMQLRAEHDPSWTNPEVKAYEMKLVQRFQKEYKSDRLELYVYSQTYVEEEMVRAGISLVPYLTVGFFVMLTCADHLGGRPLAILLAVAACLLPFMSCAVALGLLFTLGLRFGSILCIIPFLVLAIGVDSSFLMIHEWQRVCKHSREHPSRKSMQVGYRVAELLSEVGPAILISVLTNIFADGVGAFTSSREITILCVGNLTSMIVAYAFQMTFYSALFSIVGRYEINTERRERTEFEASLRAAKFDRKQHLNRQPSKVVEVTKEYISTSMQAYVNFVANRFVALTTIFIYFVYLGFSIYGITQINISLTSSKLFSMDSPLLHLDQLRVEYQVPHFTMATVFVNNPGNLSDPARLAKLDQFVDEMEHIHGSWGPVGTQYFVRDYRTFVNTFDGPSGRGPGGRRGRKSPPPPPRPRKANKQKALSFKGDDLEAFVKWPEYSYWGGFLKLDNETHELEKFFFTTAYRGKEISIWTKRRRAAQPMAGDRRQIPGPLLAVCLPRGRRLPRSDRKHADGHLARPPLSPLLSSLVCRQSVAGTLACMALICYAFLNSIFTVVMASACVLSICVGILGCMSYWNIDLDPISMAAMVISIGCSVDIPAHVSYHYYQAATRENPDGDNSSQYKLANCLSSVAFPAVQAGISTILCISSLLFIKLYMSEVFVKTFVVCVVLCNVHGLIFLPAFLIVFDSIVSHFRPRVGDASGRPLPPSSVASSNGKRNGKKNGGIPDQHNRTTDRPDVSPNHTPEPSPRPSPRPPNGESRRVLQPAEPRNGRNRTPEPSAHSVSPPPLPDESGMTTIELADPPSPSPRPKAADTNGVDNRKRAPFVKKQSAVEDDRDTPPV